MAGPSPFKLSLVLLAAPRDAIEPLEGVELKCVF